jgi:hypothetical protein
MNYEDLDKWLCKIETQRIFENPINFFTPNQVVEITFQFMTFSMQTRDWRFLNTALKLSDWLHANGHITQELEKMQATAMTALRSDCGLNLSK